MLMASLRSWMWIPTLALLGAGCQSKLPEGAVLGKDFNTTHAIEPAAISAPYVLRAGDVIHVRLFYHPELNDRPTIQPDGRITLQLVGEVEAAGKTLMQFSETLKEEYGRQLKNPSVTVSLAETAKQRIYVGGQVRSPGAYTLETPKNCLQVITEAGGFLREAEPSSVVVLRNQGTKAPLFIIVDLKQSFTKPDQNSDLALQPQDIVIVPMSTISQMNQFVDQYITKMIPAQTSVGVFYDLTRRPNN